MSDRAKRIFIVEDETLIASLIKEQLMRLGYEVRGVAASGETAVEQIPEARPDLILMDVELGQTINGIDAAGYESEVLTNAADFEAAIARDRRPAAATMDLMLDDGAGAGTGRGPRDGRSNRCRA